MKKVISVFLALLLLSLTALSCSASAQSGLLLALDGGTEYKIVISENATATERTAATELSRYLNEISSAQFDIITDAQAPSPKEIVIGVTNRDRETELDRESLTQDEVRIFTVGKKLFLTGDEQRGAIYAVFTLLEEYLGCRWFTHELTVIPQMEKIELPPLNYSFAPPFKLRQTYWMFSTMYADFCVQHKLHSYMASIGSSWGGSPSELCISSVHTLQWIITRDMFEQHPEYFGCDENGVRSPLRQPCLSNEEVLQITIAYAKRFFAQHNVILSISQNDGMSFCRCESCTNFNRAHGGSDSASMLSFVNRVAEAVREDYPDARFETLAYQDTLTPPKGLAVAPGIVIRLCPLNGCVLHDFDDSSCKKNKSFDKALSAWAELTDSIYMWNYSTNFQYYYAPFPNITSLQKRYQYFKDNSCIAIFDNGCGENMVAGEFHELRTYLVAKLMWDPDTDVQRHIREFCAAYYGAAAEDIVEFIYEFEKSVKGYKPLAASSCHMTCQDGGESLEHNTALTELEIKRLDRLIKRAQAKDLSEDEARHLQGVAISYRFFKCATFSGEFNWLSFKNEPISETQRLYSDMRDYGIGFLSEGGGHPLMDDMPNCTVRPTWWFASPEELPQSIKLESKLLPLINKILRTIFWFCNINRE